MADSTFTIFYSWQSDLPNSTTRGLIESSIEAAVRSLRNTVSVYADRDTQGVTGSPDIVQTIFSKIDECDVFVADVTSVATYHPLDKDGNENAEYFAQDMELDAFAYSYAVMKYKYGEVEYLYIPKAYRNEEFDKIVAKWQETFKDENL